MRLIPGLKPLPRLPLLRLQRSPFTLKALWVVMLGLAIALSGCVESDVGVHFQSPNRGEIVQHIEWSERLQSLSGARVMQWMQQVERQAGAVGGTVQKEVDQALTIKIPFTSSDELEQKFNQFANGIFNPELWLENSNLPLMASQLQVDHSNFLLLERDRLTYNIDLRALGVSSSGNLLVSPTALIRLQFYLETPWGARSVIRSDTLRPRSLQGGKRLIWNLIPGEQNTLETVFWLPNPLGLGTLVIVGLVLLGIFLKYPQWLADGQPSAVSPVRRT